MHINLADALVAPDVLRPFLVNWAEVVRYFIRSVEADAAADGSNETNALLERLLAYKGARSATKSPVPEQAKGPVLPMHFRKGETTLALVHDHCDPRNTPGRNGAGAPGRELFPDGPGDGNGPPLLGVKDKNPAPGAAITLSAA